MPPATVALPGLFRQLGWVVRDLDAAIAEWVALGVGPWFVIRDIPQTALYRGEPVAITISIAFANNGDMQLELIQQRDDTPSVHTEWLAAGNEGLNQLAWWAPDFDGTVAGLRAAGWTEVWLGTDPGTRFAYYQRPTGPVSIIEIMEFDEGAVGMSAMLEAAAADWDGSDPVRPLF